MDPVEYEGTYVKIHKRSFLMICTFGSVLYFSVRIIVVYRGFIRGYGIKDSEEVIKYW